MKSDPCKGGIYLLYRLQEMLFCTVAELINLPLKMFNGHLSMVHYLSGFVARDLSGFAVERLFRFISSIQGGDIDGSGKVSAKSQDESVQASLR